MDVDIQAPVARQGKDTKTAPFCQEVLFKYLLTAKNAFHYSGLNVINDP